MKEEGFTPRVLEGVVQPFECSVLMYNSFLNGIITQVIPPPPSLEVALIPPRNSPYNKEQAER